ncbi:MAG: SAM-dependent methyltransferase [Bacteroidia bacterium]|nr:SAM-dependent methyltransferase [Bacteroidia bacterium]
MDAINTKTRIFLIPNYLAEDNPIEFLSEYVRMQVHTVQHFIVENEKQARALIKRLNLKTPQSDLKLLLWNEHSKPSETREVEDFLNKKVDIGIITDAGLPCIADPGADIVAIAHKKDIEVIPLPGPSSIFMALMASGMNGQGFTFNGYLPIDKLARSKRLKQLELDAMRLKHTQLFMETPYRNNQLLADIIINCKGDTLLCIACNISSKDGFVKTKSINQWKQIKPDLHKQPTIFAFGV